MTTLDNIKKMAETGCKGFTCDECPVAEFCSVMSHTGETGSTLAEALLDLLSYDSDISKCEVGDWVWDQRLACWLRIISMGHTKLYPIMVEGDLSYTLDGKFYSEHKLPTIFVEPPLCFNPGPRPKPKRVCAFKDGDRVLVKNRTTESWVKAIFCKYVEDDKYSYNYVTYTKGKDAWTSDGETVCWKYCKKVGD